MEKLAHDNVSISLYDQGRRFLRAVQSKNCRSVSGALHVYI